MLGKMRHGIGLAAGLLVLSWLICMDAGLAQNFAEATPGEAVRCPHEHVEVRTTHENVAYEQENAQVHVREYDELTVMLCLDCAMELNRSSVPKSAEEAHAFDASGVCTMCGAQAASGPAEEDAARTKTPDAFLEAIDQAVEEGADVRVDVVGAQELLTEAEYDALKALPVREQILVTLACVDWGTDGALDAPDVPVSGQAVSLLEEIGARLNALTPEERGAQEARLAELFPVGEKAADGVMRPYRAFDVRIDVDGETRVQRYDLPLDQAP